jgi:hypothetical protein
MLRQIKNPKEAVINMVSNNNNPMVKNLVEMAKNGDNEGVENFARNLLKEQGRDFDKEYSEFMNIFK